MTEDNPTADKTTIAPEVLMTIARLTALAVPGVSRLVPIPHGVHRLLKRNPQQEGVVIEVQEDTVGVDLYLAMLNGVNVREVGQNVQAEVGRAISDMVGMQSGRINVHIEEIDFPTEAQDSET
jgi:uncharacterized alkaline shock family protein YloU